MRPDSRTSRQLDACGGNTHAAIARVGDTVRRPTGPRTPAVHELLAHVESRGVAAPRALGMDERGREILTFIPRDVIWPGHVELVHIARNRRACQLALN